MAKRFVIEGEWSGYTSSQGHVVHRTVHEGAFKKLRAWVEKTHGIRYTDGTMLYLTTRDCKPRERVNEIRGYLSLIYDCAHYDVDNVAALPSKRAAIRTEATSEAAAK